MKPEPLDALLHQVFAQVPIILAVCYLGRHAARAFGQPGVVGEMVGGIVLGPSVLGILFPAVQSALFPPDSQPALFLLSQIGLAFYMFTVGLDFNPDLLRGFAGRAGLVSAAGVALPLALGAGLMPFLTRVGLLRADVPGPHLCARSIGYRVMAPSA